MSYYKQFKILLTQYFSVFFGTRHEKHNLKTKTLQKNISFWPGSIFSHEKHCYCLKETAIEKFWTDS